MEKWHPVTVGRGAWKRVVGRTWTAIVEPPGGIKRANWHVALNTIVDDDGFERKIVRESMTSGRAGRGEFGTYFIGDAQRDLRPWLPDRGSSGPVLDGSPIWTAGPQRWHRPVHPWRRPRAAPRPGRGNRLHGARRERIELYFPETLTYTDEAVVVLEA